MQHANDNDIGVAVIDAFTHYVLEFMEKINKTSQISMKELFDSIDPAKLGSHPGYRTDLFKRPLEKTLITDFFGGVARVEVSPPTSAMGQVFAEPGSSQPEEKQTSRNSSSPSVDKPSSKIDKPDFNTLVSSWLSSPETKTVRAWAGVALVGGLVGWVFSK